MKKITFFGFFAYLIFVSQISFSQCNVGCDVLEDGTKYFMAAKEKLYVNEDFEYGILAAYVQLVVIQHPVEKDLLQFVMYINVGRSGSKQMIVPRQIKIFFTDGTTIELMAESLESPRMVSNIYMQQSTFRLNTSYYTTLQTKSLTKVIIIDNRANNQLVCTPYKDLLIEQANCIASKLK